MRRPNNANQNEESELEKAIRIAPARFRNNGVPICNDFINRLKEALDTSGTLTQLHLWDEIGPNQSQMIFNILKEVKINFVDKNEKS